MEKPIIKVALVSGEAVLPSKIAENSGYDLYTIQQEDVVLLHGEKFNFDTGVVVEVPNEWGVILKEKGGMGNKNVGLRAGVVDAGFRGQIVVIMTNEDPKPAVFNRNPENYKALEATGKATIIDMNKAITQFMLVYTPDSEVVECDFSDLSSSDRGDKKFGKGTGK